VVPEGNEWSAGKTITTGRTSYFGCLGSYWSWGQFANGPAPPGYVDIWPGDGLTSGGGAFPIVGYLAPLRWLDFADGLSNTFLIGEDVYDANVALNGPRQTNIPNAGFGWNHGGNAVRTAAIRLNYPRSDLGDWTTLHGFHSNHPGGALFALADGSTRFVANGISRRAYLAAGTIRGGEAYPDF
jgi:hypothetical protein